MIPLRGCLQLLPDSSHIDVDMQWICLGNERTQARPLGYVITSTGKVYFEHFELIPCWHNIPQCCWLAMAWYHCQEDNFRLAQLICRDLTFSLHDRMSMQGIPHVGRDDSIQFRYTAMRWAAHVTLLSAAHRIAVQPTYRLNAIVSTYSIRATYLRPLQISCAGLKLSSWP